MIAIIIYYLYPVLCTLQIKNNKEAQELYNHDFYFIIPFLQGRDNKN